jgi:hypothetical protein
MKADALQGRFPVAAARPAPPASPRPEPAEPEAALTWYLCRYRLATGCTHGTGTDSGTTLHEHSIHAAHPLKLTTCPDAAAWKAAGLDVPGCAGRKFDGPMGRGAHMKKAHGLTKSSRLWSELNAQQTLQEWTARYGRTEARQETLPATVAPASPEPAQAAVPPEPVPVQIAVTEAPVTGTPAMDGYGDLVDQGLTFFDAIAADLKRLRVRNAELEAENAELRSRPALPPELAAALRPLKAVLAAVDLGDGNLPSPVAAVPAGAASQDRHDLAAARDMEIAREALGAQPPWLTPRMQEVAQARVDHPEWSWAQLAEALGISRDAASGTLRQIRMVVARSGAL